MHSASNWLGGHMKIYWPQHLCLFQLMLLMAMLCISFHLSTITIVIDEGKPDDALRVFRATHTTAKGDFVDVRSATTATETMEEFQQMRTRLTEHEEKERFLMEQIESMRRDQEVMLIAQEDRMRQERLEQERMRQERLEQEERIRQEVAAVRKEQDSKFL